MAELDVQKQLEEAATERSGIAEALLSIQQTLDRMAPAVAKMEPTVAKMEPALVALEPVVQDLATWRPTVDAAVGQLQVDLGDIRAQLEKIAAGASPTNKPAPAPIQADAPHLNTRQSDDGHGQIGRRWALLPRVSASEGSILTTPVPANGTYQTPFPTAPLPPPPSFDLGGCSSGFGGSRFSNKHVETPLVVETRPQILPAQTHASSTYVPSSVICELESRTATRCLMDCLHDNPNEDKAPSACTFTIKVNTTSDGFGGVLRPRPWPSFVCKLGPVHRKESCTHFVGTEECPVHDDYWMQSMSALSNFSRPYASSGVVYLEHNADGDNQIVSSLIHCSKEKEHACEADIVEFNADYVLSSLRDLLYDGKLSLCHFNFDHWVIQISKAEEKVLFDGIADLCLLGAIKTVVAKDYMSKIEQIGNPHRATSLYELKFFDTSGQISQLGSKDRNIISADNISNVILHLTFSEKIASCSFLPFQQVCNTQAKLIIQWDPGVPNTRESAWISLLHLVTTGVQLILPWDPGNYSRKISTKWLPLKSSTTNVNLCFPWDPGEQGFMHVQNVETTFHLASTNSYVMYWKFTCHEEFKWASSFQEHDFSLVSSSYVMIIQPGLKSEIDVQPRLKSMTTEQSTRTEFGKRTLTEDGIGLLGRTINHFANCDYPPKVLLSTHLMQIFTDNYLPQSELIKCCIMSVLNLDGQTSNQDVIFLYKLVPGHELVSFGLHCAQLAGIPSKVIQSAVSVLEDIHSKKPAKHMICYNNFEARDKQFQEAEYCWIPPSNAESGTCVEVDSTYYLETLASVIMRWKMNQHIFCWMVRSVMAPWYLDFRDQEKVVSCSYINLPSDLLPTLIDQLLKFYPVSTRTSEFQEVRFEFLIQKGNYYVKHLQVHGVLELFMGWRRRGSRCIPSMQANAKTLVMEEYNKLNTQVCAIISTPWDLGDVFLQHASNSSRSMVAQGLMSRNIERIAAPDVPILDRELHTQWDPSGHTHVLDDGGLRAVSSTIKSTSTMATTVKGAATTLAVPWDLGRNYSASALGQAEFQGGRNVTGTTTQASEDQDTAQPLRPKRSPRPNTRVTGLDWAT